MENKSPKCSGKCLSSVLPKTLTCLWFSCVVHTKALSVSRKSLNVKCVSCTVTRLLINIKRTVYLLRPSAVSRNIQLKVLIIHQPSLLSSGCTRGPDMCTHSRSVRFTTGTADSWEIVWCLSHWAGAGRWSASGRFWFSRGC